ncbi:C4-dicarboxylate anaerobic carrier protein [Scopulibacillus darangshiensis]|uniref:C4-dicarboxylate anaerobic carrier protein n=1 Tax=Scopulibacillus darangshiensis TaxID=442528 RepID=A0A4R2NC78_9BACL|nr:hypothetical protein [Scopulibacillus darangshiensis]TCP18727.1 C4-dicarboxylate anaerobic carrier protein [Scopulibacillus darangshiensis]
MNLATSPSTNEKKRHLKVPHVFVILFCIIVLAAIVTYLVPAGEYKRITKDGATLVVDGTYQVVSSSPAKFMDIFKSIHQGMIDSAGIIFYIFIVGGSFGIFRATGAIQGAVGSIANKIKPEIFIV